MIDAQRARELLDAATPGPWKVRVSEISGLHIDAGEHGYDDVIETEVDCGRYCLGGTAVVIVNPHDAALIAAAPELAATVIALEAKRDALAAQLATKDRSEP